MLPAMPRQGMMQELSPSTASRKDTSSLGKVLLQNNTRSSNVRSQMEDLMFIQEPQEYLSTLIRMISTSQKRVILSALYLGIDDDEQKLVKAIDDSLSDQSRPELSVKIVLDKGRATRGLMALSAEGSCIINNDDLLRQKNSLTILGPLIEKHHPRLQIHLYEMPHTKSSIAITNALSPLSPIIGKSWEKVIELFGEVRGVYHVKFALFDESCILTGANLSAEYFISRQDRYAIVRDENVCNYLQSFYDIVQNHSVQVSCIDQGIALSRRRNDLFALSQELKNLSPGSGDIDINRSNISTTFHPIIQHASIRIYHEESLQNMLQSLRSILIKDLPLRRIVLSSPYPSFRRHFIQSIAQLIKSTNAVVSVVTTSNESHGFARGSGIKTWIPKLHDRVFRDAMASLKKITGNKSNNVTILRFHRPDWTFHAKGLWIEMEEGEFIGLVPLFVCGNIFSYYKPAIHC